MALWLTTRIFWIACCAIVLYALPITDENDLVFYWKKIGYFDKTSNLETLPIRAKEAIPIPIMDPPKSTGLSETGEQENDTIAMMNVPLYGVKNSTERSTRKKRTLPDPPICDNSRLDAIARTASGSVFAFQGLFYWELLENGKAEFYPRRIVRDWSGLDGPVDAAFTLPTGDTYIYKDPDLWKFRNKSKSERFPKTLYLAFGRDVRALSGTLNAAYTSGKNNITYFFKGNKFIKYKIDGDLLQADKDLQPISGGPWNMTLNFVDAAIQWNNRTTYFFKEQNYYIYDHVEKKFYEEAHSIGNRWFGCGRRH